MRWICCVCGGAYDDTLRDGGAYYHACPPVVNSNTGEVRPRPQARDERPPRDAPAGSGAVRAEGAGRVPFEEE